MHHSLTRQQSHLQNLTPTDKTKEGSVCSSRSLVESEWQKFLARWYEAHDYTVHRKLPQRSPQSEQISPSCGVPHTTGKNPEEYHRISIMSSERYYLAEKTIDFLKPKSKFFPRVSLHSKIKTTPLTLKSQTTYQPIIVLLPEKLRLRYAVVSVSVVAIVAMFILLPMKGWHEYAKLHAEKEKIIGNGITGVEQMQSAGIAIKMFDLEKTNQFLVSASNYFASGEERLQNISPTLQFIFNLVPSKRVEMDTARALFSLGQHFSIMGRSLTLILASWKEINDKPLIQKIETSERLLQTAFDEFEDAKQEITKVDPRILDPDQYDFFNQLQDVIPLIEQTLLTTLALHETGLELLGANDLKRYLVVFQNNTELRATGGFMGSFALIDVANGAIKQKEVPGGGFYDLQENLRETLTPPEPLKLLTPRWEVQDANWWPDFPTSAKKLTWFYEQSTSRTVDGVIAVNATLLPRLLELFGPIDLPEYGKTLNSENALLELQKTVELEYDRALNRPKQIIADALPILMERFFKSDINTTQQVARLLTESLDHKEIQVFFYDQQAQELFAEMQWTGSMAVTKPEDDFLSVIHTNLGGRKTDGVMEETIHYEVDMTQPQTKVATLTISRKHSGIKGDPFTGVGNVDYLRVYVPLGSILLSAQGFDRIDGELFEQSLPHALQDENLAQTESNKRKENLSGTDIYEEFGKNVFGNWILIDPGETKIVELRYTLPSSVAPGTQPASPYYLIWQKQSGTRNTEAFVTVKYPLIWHLDKNSITYEPILSSDESITLNQLLESDWVLSVPFIL